MCPPHSTIALDCVRTDDSFASIKIALTLYYKLRDIVALEKPPRNAKLGYS